MSGKIASARIFGVVETFRFRLSILFFCLVTPVLLRAQDHSEFTQFYLNPYLLNPAYAGSDGQPSVSLLYRRQWMTIEGAPAITNITLQAPIKHRLSGAIGVTNESAGFFNNSEATFSAAYFVPLREGMLLRFGISAGGSWNTVDMRKLEDVNDPALSGVLAKNAALTGNAGMVFQYKGFTAGASMPALFAPSYVSSDAFNVTEPAAFKSLIFHVSNRFYFNGDKNIFEPYVVYRLARGLPSLLEIAGILHLNHLVWVGGSYKQQYGVSALGGLTLNSKLAIGASYSIGQRGADELNSPSFEIGISYLFGKKSKEASVYSFVNTDKPVNRVAAANRRPVVRKAQAQAAAIDQAGQKAPVREPEVKNPPSVANEQVEPSAVVQPPVEEQVAPSPGRKPEGELQLISPRVKPPAGVRHETVKSASQANELKPGEYVIAGSFRSQENARQFADGLKELDVRTNYGFVAETNLWYVYTLRTDDAERARKEQQRVSKIFLLRDAWWLSVKGD